MVHCLYISCLSKLGIIWSPSISLQFKLFFNLLSLLPNIIILPPLLLEIKDSKKASLTPKLPLKLGLSSSQQDLRALAPSKGFSNHRALFGTWSSITNTFLKCLIRNILSLEYVPVYIYICWSFIKKCTSFPLHLHFIHPFTLHQRIWHPSISEEQPLLSSAFNQPTINSLSHFQLLKYRKPRSDNLPIKINFSHHYILSFLP